jgi:hypothetical protein
MLAREMPSSTSSVLTASDQTWDFFTGTTGGKHPSNGSPVVGNFSVVPSVSVPVSPAWANWGKHARRHTINELALSRAFHNPHALLTLLPNISLSIYKGLP